MALLENDLYTIEVGSKIWRHILNINFANIYSIAEVDSIILLYSDTVHSHTGYKDRTTAESEIAAAMEIAFDFDIKYSEDVHGIVMLDRTTATYKRLYVHSGSLLVEDV